MRPWAGRLAGAAAHLAILVLPVAVLGLGPAAGADPAVWLFLLGATSLYWAESAARPVALREPCPETPAVHRVAQLTGVVMLAAFWAGLIERTLRGSDFGWPQFAGLAGMGLGIGLRVAAIHTLGRFFRTEIAVERDQPLVQSGVYRLVRHPSETGLLLCVFGVATLFESVAAAVLGLALIPLSLWRVRREDRRLHDAFPAEFSAYAGRVKRLVPFVY
jgi:protein-S-isoprenylcysteine O-methyltransferase Ste14